MKTMRLLDFAQASWAITPEAFDALRDFYASVAGERLPMKALNEKLEALGPGLAQANLSEEFDVIDGVAVIQVNGVLSRHLSLFSFFFGGTSTIAVGDAITAAMRDDEVHAVVLDIDSPGGEVAGTQELAQLIRNAKKPVAAHTAGMMASAAYWVGSAARAGVFISGDTPLVGSIGIISRHLDRSGQLKDAGIVATEIVSGKFKNVGSDLAPLSKESREILQAQSDALYSTFVNEVAEGRDAPVKRVLEVMAEGRVFVGREAIDAGLVDDVASMNDLVASLRSIPSRKSGARANVGAPILTAEDENVDWTAIDLNALTEHRPDLVAEAVAQAVAQATTAARDEGSAAGICAGATAERERIQEVEAQVLPGHEALIATLKFDGKTTGPEAAVQVLAAERGNCAAHLAVMESEAEAAAAIAETSAPGPDKGFLALVDEKVAAGTKRGLATREVINENPEAHKAFMEGQSSAA